MKNDATRRAIHRIRILKGLMNKLENSVEEKVYCIDVLKQSLAIQRALKSLDGLMLESHLDTCVKKKITPAKEGERLTEELLELYNLSRKSN